MPSRRRQQPGRPGKQRKNLKEPSRKKKRRRDDDGLFPVMGDGETSVSSDVSEASGDTLINLAKDDNITIEVIDLAGDDSTIETASVNDAGDVDIDELAEVNRNEEPPVHEIVIVKPREEGGAYNHAMLAVMALLASEYFTNVVAASFFWTIFLFLMLLLW